MSSIGDLWFQIRGDSRPLITDASKAGDVAGTGFAARFLKGFNAQSVGKAIVQGAGIGGGLLAFNSLTSAIGGTVAVLADAVKAFNEDQASIALLNTSLKANIANWDGNTTAIEGVLKARMALGFSDDEQRNSLGLLVAATHDVNKALEIEATAMDLARFKHISLADATEALTRVEAGSYRILKSLGIELPKNATQTQALAAVQAVAAGQAADYAQTNEGKLLVSQVKVREAEEKFGKVLADLEVTILPPLADAVTGLADGFVTLEGDVAAVVKQLDLYVGSTDAAAQNSDWLGSKTDPLGKALHGIADAFGELLKQRDDTNRLLFGTADVWGQTASDMTTTTDHFQKDFQDNAASIAKALKDAADEVDTSLAAIVTSFTKARTELQTAATGAADAIYDPIITKAKLAQVEREMAEDRQTIASRTATAKQKQDANDRMTENNKKQIELLGLLATYGDTSAKKTLATMIETMKATKGLSVEQITALDLLLSKLNQVKVAYANFPRDRFDPQGGRASGGYVPPGWVGDVGETGREKLVMYPGGGGYVIPHGGLPAAAYVSGGGSTEHVSVATSRTFSPSITIHNPVPHAAPEDAARMMRRLAALGVGG